METQKIQHDLKAALEIFFDTGDETHVKSILVSNPDMDMNLHGDYPDLHRIADFKVDSCSYRVLRLASQNELLSVVLIDESDRSEEAGVPIWVDGALLRGWVEDETNEPSKCAIDWYKYR